MRMNYSETFGQLEKILLTNSTISGSSPTTQGHRVTTAFLLEREISRWMIAFTIILGLVTNSLIALVLFSKTWKSCASTRIVLLFLAVTDIVVMLMEFFLHYVPLYWRWFPVYYNRTCGVATVMQPTVLTCAAWYVTLMTLERFIAVCFPMKAKRICTEKLVIIVCALMPALCFCLYAYFLPNMVAVKRSGYTICRPRKDQDGDVFKVIMQIWITAYFFIPTAAIILLNAGIVYKLRIARRTHKEMTNQAAESTKYSPCPTNSTQLKNINRTFRKATIMVIVASVVFVILMIPRGVVTTLMYDVNWKYGSRGQSIADTTAYVLQYLNHATNFFVYILTNGTFRKSLIDMCTCKKKKSQLSSQGLAITSVTNETAVDQV